METVNVHDIHGIQDFQESKLVKKVPIISPQLMSTVLVIGSKTTTPTHKHQSYDEIHYIIKGTGEIVIENESQTITEGMIILVPQQKQHHFNTSDEHMLVLSINIVPEMSNNKA